MKFFNDGSPDAWCPNHDPERVPTPVGEPCLHCGVVFKDDDCGIVLPHVAETTAEKPWHIKCLREALGIERAEA